MKSFQERTLERIESAAKQHGVECSASHDWANTGRVNLHEKNAAGAFGFVRYDFQTSNYKLALHIHGRQIPSQPGRADYFDFYQNNDGMTLFWDVFNRELANRNER